MIKKILIILLFLNTYSLNADGEDVKDITFFVKDYRPITLKLLYLKDEQQKRVGLMNNKVIPYDGLLLELDENEMPRIWMKNMLIPIDVIFISEENKILATIEKATPCKKNDDCSISTVRGTKYIIETKAGFIIDNYINYADSVAITD